MDVLGWLASDSARRILYSLLPVLVGALVAVAKTFFRNQRYSHALRAKIATITAIEDLSANPNLSVRYSDMQIQTLKVSTAIVWNAGQDEIRRENLAPAGLPTLVLPEGTLILEASVLMQTTAATRAQVAAQDASIALDFDFLNPNDAVVVHCLHTGPLEEVTLEGTLIGKAPNVASEWEHQAGIHGGNDQPNQLVDLRLLSNIGAAVNLVFVSGLLAAFLFATWWPVLAVAITIFAASVWALLPNRPIPRKVLKGLRETEQ